MNFLYNNRFHSCIIRGGAFFTGDTIEINNQIITLKRNHILSKEFYSISIPLVNIINVQVIRHKAGADIVVESQSQSYIISKGYRYASACKMKQLILK